MTNDILLSVIIPSHWRPDKSHNMLIQLKNQSLDKSLYEVILVNDSGSDEMKEQFEAVFREESLTNALLVHRERETSERVGAGIARNYGAIYAKGTHLLFLDDDILFESDFLKHYFEIIKANRDALICGNLKHLPPRSSLQIFLTSSKTYFGYGDLKHGKDCEYDNFFTGNCAIPRAIFEQHPFEKSNTYGYEDLLYAYGQWKNGKKFIFNERSVAIHNDNVEFSEFIIRKFQAANKVPSITFKYPELGRKLHYNPILRYFPIKNIPSEKVLKIIGSFLDIFVRITKLYFIYRFVLGLVFAAGISSGFSRKR